MLNGMSKKGVGIVGMSILYTSFAAVLGSIPLMICVVRFVAGIILLIEATSWGFEFVPSPWLLIAECCFLNTDFCLLIF